MKDGFVKVAAATPKIKVADTQYNAEAIISEVKEACADGAKIVVLPELCITGYSCSDLFLQDKLLASAREQLGVIADRTADCDALLFIGMPLEKDHKLFNVAAVVQHGHVLAFIPKTYLPNYGEFYEARHFASGEGQDGYCRYQGEEIPFGTDILFECDTVEGLVVGCEICEDIWTPNPPNTRHALAGATVMVNLSASNELVGKDTYREELVKLTSARLIAGYIYSSAGDGESTQDVVYGGHDLIAENGTLLAQSTSFTTGIIYADLDIAKLRMERRKMTTYLPREDILHDVIPFTLKVEETKLSRKFDRAPFVPSDKTTREKRCEQILSIQANGLKKRYEHTGSKTAVIGISGGLDSTLALLVTVRAFDMLGLPRENIKAVTMPCFGTTDRTYQNAVSLIKELGATLKEVRIEKAVRQHFADIGHDENNHDVTYENSQARERTQILMDMANQYNGMVIGTGDMSELALGWATYNGDHMSMYAVNCSVPKTLVRYLVLYYAETTENKKLSEVLMDVLDTPVSPELLPPVDGVISQKTEDLVGPYELHDFFLYYMLRFGFPKAKLYRMAKLTFDGVYDDETIKKWLDKFYWRFFSQQFKRSCLPDGPKVGSVAVSPRGDLRMPSDASPTAWL